MTEALDVDGALERERKRKREYARRWRAANPGVAAARAAKRRAAAPDTVREINRRSYEKNKVARRAAKREEYAQKKELLRERKRAYRDENKEHACRVAKEWWEKNKARRRGYNLINRYGITLPQYDEMLAAQAGVCKICAFPHSEAKKLHVDHCHDTGKIRGLLCTTCNTAIGKLRHSPEILRSAIRYLSCESEYGD